jgi:hypothetical protein
MSLLATYRAALTQDAGNSLQHLKSPLCSVRSAIIDADVFHTHENARVKALSNSQSSHMVGFDITKDRHAMSRSRVASALAWKCQNNATIRLLETGLTVI